MWTVIGVFIAGMVVLLVGGVMLLTLQYNRSIDMLMQADDNER